ncbi:hypothetical protein D4Q76_00590 [archaeon]|nr:MAG: hypothetical protein D4Q76_00590 [archaeon]
MSNPINYIKEKVDDFFTVGYALKEKRAAEAKKEIEKILYKDNLFGGDANVSFIAAEYFNTLRKITEHPERWLEGTNEFCRRYGKNEKEIVGNTIAELESKYKTRVEFLKEALKKRKIIF